VVGPEQAQVMEQEVQSLLVKKAIDLIPPPERNTWYYSSEKGWRVTSYHRSSSAEPVSGEIQVQDPDNPSYCEPAHVRGLFCQDQSSF